MTDPSLVKGGQGGGEPGTTLLLWLTIQYSQPGGGGPRL